MRSGLLDKLLPGPAAPAAKPAQKAAAPADDERYEWLALAQPRGLLSLTALFSGHELFSGLDQRWPAFELALTKNNFVLAAMIVNFLSPEEQRKAFFIALKNHNDEFAKQCLQAIPSKDRFAIFLDLNQESSVDGFSFFARFRADPLCPRLDQAHLNEQMAKLADCLGNNAFAKAIRENLGFCFAWGHAEAVMRALDKGALWDAAKLLLSMWSGAPESLEACVFLPGIDRPVAVKNLLAWVVNSIYQTQQADHSDDSLCLPLFCTTQFASHSASLDWVNFVPSYFGKEEEEEEYDENGEPLTVKPRFVSYFTPGAAGQFTQQQLIDLLLAMLSDELSRTQSYVAVCTFNHFIYLRAELSADGSVFYRVSDCNRQAPQLFSSLELVAKCLIETQGPVLDLSSVRVASYSEEPVNCARPLDLPRQQFTVTDPRFFALLLGLPEHRQGYLLFQNEIAGSIWDAEIELSYEGFFEENRKVSAPVLLHAVCFGRAGLVEILLNQGQVKPYIVSMAKKIEGYLPLKFFEALSKTFHLCFAKLETEKQKQLALCGLVDLAQKAQGDLHWPMVRDLIAEQLEQAGFSQRIKNAFPVSREAAECKEQLLRWQGLAKPSVDSSSQVRSSFFSQGPAARPNTQHVTLRKKR